MTVDYNNTGIRATASGAKLNNIDVPTDHWAPVSEFCPNKADIVTLNVVGNVFLSWPMPADDINVDECTRLNNSDTLEFMQ